MGSPRATTPGAAGRAAVTICAAALSGACAAVQTPRPAIGAAALGHPVASMDLPRLGGGSVSLQALRGHPVIAFMFTTWSLRSQMEAPRFARIQRQRPAVRVLPIALDRANRPLVRAFVDFVGLRGDVALATPDDLELVGAFGRTVRVPRTVLLDREGRIVQDHQGLTNFPKLERGLEALR